MRYQRFLDVSQSSDLPTFEQRLVDFANGMDFGIVSAVLVLDKPGRDVTVVTVGNTPEGFAEASRDAADSARDPVLKRLKRLSIPFVYDQGLYVKEQAGDLWEQQAEFGYRTGISVALHLQGHKHFLLGVDRVSPLPKKDEKVTRMLADLQLLAVHAQDAALRLLMPNADGGEPAPTLTSRELEVLRWTMEGKSAWVIGELLSIAEKTVNFHINNVLRKMNVASKHQAVLKALNMGLL